VLDFRTQGVPIHNLSLKEYQSGSMTDGFVFLLSPSLKVKPVHVVAPFFVGRKQPDLLKHGVTIIRDRVGCESSCWPFARINEFRGTANSENFSWRPAKILYEKIKRSGYQLSSGRLMVASDLGCLIFPFTNRCRDPRTFRVNEGIGTIPCGSRSFGSFGYRPSKLYRLLFDGAQGAISGSDANRADDKQCGGKHKCYAVNPIPRYRHGGKFDDSYGFACIVAGYILTVPFVWRGLDNVESGRRLRGWGLFAIGILCDALATGSLIVGCLPWSWWTCLHDGNEHSDNEYFHGEKVYHGNFLTTLTFCNTVNDMANVLPKDKQVAIISALAEGSSIRSIERISGVHRDTIMRLGVRVGNGCGLLLDSKMQDLGCRYLQFDEVWGFIGKKERHVRVDDNPELGDVWTYCAIDPETKLVPSFKVGKRNIVTTADFVKDVASRMRHRVQVSSDAMTSYVEAMERAFGADVDYGQCVKVYVHDSAQHPERKYSAPHFASAIRRPITGQPDMEMVSTSHVERLNATTRLHVKRLSRLTLAFSKKLENFRAAVALHFAYYNLVKRHSTLRCTPAMAAGIERDFLTVGDLVDAAV